MYCPACGSEERQLSQYCRACGTDLRAVRQGLERPDTITASAVSAREQISRALADRIRQLETGKDLEHVAEDVLPNLEKFLESPEEKRLRRLRKGVITALVGLGVGVANVIFTEAFNSTDYLPFAVLGFIVFLIGLGVVINGLVFTVPRRTLANRSAEAESQRELEARIQSVQPASQLPSFSRNTNDLPADQRIGRTSVTEHTTHQLRQDKS